MNFKKYICEFIGTAVLVLVGCGTAALTSGQEILLISIAFGLSIVAMAYVIGNISGCHINPAVSLAMLINKKITVFDFIGYVVAQILGAFAGAGLLCAIFNSCTKITGGVTVTGLGTNGFGDLSAVGISLFGAIIIEVILTFIFIYTILGVTSDKSKSSIAGIVIGLTLTFVHLLGIAFTGTSVNPARSLAPAAIMAMVGKAEALQQVWVFIVAPFVGAALASVVFKLLNKEKKEN